jgi:hypothetical protein
MPIELETILDSGDLDDMKLRTTDALDSVATLNDIEVYNVYAEITVSKGTGGDFTTIQEAIDFAVTEYPARDVDNQVIITVSPGDYVEQIHSYVDIVIQSAAAAYDPVQGRAKATISNVGDAAGTYPLRTDVGDVYYMIGMNISTDTADNVFGYLPEGTFKNCSFRYGHFIENPEFTHSQFKDCSFANNTYGGFNVVSAVATSGSNINLDRCIHTGRLTFLSTHPGGSDFGFIAMQWSRIRGSLHLNGDWGIQGFQLRVYGVAVRSTFDTSWEVKFEGGYMVNGIHFISSPSDLYLGSVAFESIADNQIPTGETDITADVVVFGRVGGNIMHNGLPSEIHMSNPDKFVGLDQHDGYISVKAALDSITDNDVNHRYTIQVSAGIYDEINPLIGKEYVSLKAIGDYQTTRLVAVDPLKNLLEMANFFSVEGMAFNGVTSGAAVYMDVAGIASITRCAIANCQYGIHSNHADAIIDIDDLPLANIGVFTIEKAIYVELGDVTINKVYPIGDTSVDTILDVTGNAAAAAQSVHVSANGINSDSVNVARGAHVDNGSYLTLNDSHIGNAAIGLQVRGTDTYVNVASTEIRNTVGDAIYLPNDGTNVILSVSGLTITDSGGLDLNIENVSCTVYGDIKASLNNTYLHPSANLFATIIDLEPGDEGFNILGELHVGTVENPTESVFGQGDSYTRGMLAYTFDGTNYVDISDAARSSSGSSFGFPNGVVETAIYLSSDLIDNTTADFHKYFGMKLSILTAQIGGTIVAEYDNGSTWVEFAHMISEASGSYYRGANKLFTAAPGNYQLRFDPAMEADWSPTDDPSVGGGNRYWIRFRITSSPSTLPIFEQFKLHSNRHEINADGFEEDMGTARPLIGISVPWSSFQDAGSKLGNTDLYISDNSFAGMAKNTFNTNGQSIGTVITLPPWVDTSGKLQLVVALVCNTTGTLEMTSFLNSTIDGEIIAYATPGDTIGEVSSVVSQSVVANEQITYAFEMDISDKGVQADGVAPETLWINIVASSIPAVSEVYGIVFNVGFLSWRRGSHI